MKSFTKGNITAAIKTIRTNRARSFTTMFGVIVGVLAAIVMVGIGQGARQQVQGQIGKLGKDLIVIRPGAARSDRGTFGSFDAFQSPPPGESLTDRDVRAVGRVHDVQSVTPLAVVDGSVTVGKAGRFNGQVIGTGSDFARMLHQSVDFGSFFDDDGSDSNMAVIGSDVAASLFGENVPLGRAFSFRGQTFVVTGILKSFDVAPLSNQVDFNRAVFIPFATAQQITGSGTSVYEILAQPTSPAKLESSIAGITNSLTAQHGGQQTFTVLKQSQSLAVTNDILSLLSALVLAAAAMALIVGGIGIMNIMLVSVTERMHEIGIRKAVGATNRQILAQFMSEALVLSLGGWLIGAALSIITIYLVRFFTALDPVVPWLMIVVSFVCTLLVGTLFGSVPALKAARKDPIEALRSE